MATGTIKSTGRTLLWTNPNISADFGAQTVSVDLTNYNTIAIEVRDETHSAGIFVFDKVPGGTGFYSYCRAWTGGGGIFTRFFSFVNGGIAFETGRETNLPNSYNGNVPGRAKPYKIYGFNK